MKFLLALLIAAAGAAASLPAPIEDAAKHKVKADFTYKAPAGDAALLVSDEVEGGDFPQAKVYVRSKGKLHYLGAYRSVKNVKWIAGNTTVVFEGAQLRDYGVDDVCKITYKVGARTYIRQVTGEAKDEPTG